MKKLFAILLISINLFAWEVNTHRAIDRKALEDVANLKTFVSASQIGGEDYKNEIFEGYDTTYFEYVQNGELNGMSLLNQDFQNKNYLSLLEAGAMLEDAQWPHWIDGGSWNVYDRINGRFTNHFYNPQSHWPSGSDARIWALMGSGNDYSYIDAMKYFTKGFREPNKNERRKYQAKMFVSVGHLLHVKPLHVSKGA